MNKNYNLKLDLQFRCNNSIMKFNQFDNNTSDFFMRITNGGNLVDIEKALVVLAVIKPSGKVASQFVEVKNDVIYADLKPSMKDEIGTYTAKAMLILEDERVVTDSISYEVEEDKIFSLLNDSVEDTEEFTLLTDMLNRLSTIEISEEQRMINEAERILSEENRKIEEAKRVEAELIRQHEEADRAKYDATRESNENIRKQNESIRLANETNRVNEEAKRVEEEANRVEAEQLRKDNYNFMTEDEDRRRSEANSHKEAEKLRAQAETNRVNEEAKRRTTEQARVSAENTRVSNENTRKTNEVTRQTNETKRVEAETQRQNRYNSFIADAEANANNFENYTNSAKIKEEERKSNELDRKSQEDRRVSNEVERISNENTRKANEAVREKNEASRQNTFTNKVNEVDKKIVEMNTAKDNFISSINTKVDNKISEIDKSKSDMTNTVSNKVNEVETRFNALTTSQQQDAEVIDARVDFKGVAFNSLKERIDYTDKLLRDSTVSTVTTESDFTTVEATSNGYFEDVKLEGKTLVNLATQPTNNGSINHQYATISTVANIKPSTVYTYIICNNGSETLKLYLNTNGGFDWFDLDVEANSTVIGKAKTLTTIDGDIWLSLKKAETVAQNIKVVLLEGDHTQNPPSYFEGLKSVGQSATTSEDGVDEIVVSSVKGDGNLIDLNNAHSKYCTISNDSIIGTNEYNDVQFYVYLEKGMQYFFNSNGSHDSNANIMYGMQKGHNASAICQGLKNLKTKPFTFIGDTGFYTLHIPNFRGIVKEIQLVKGDTPKPYIPHQSDKKRLLYYNEETQAWEKPILREWDSIEKHTNGKYYYHQRSGEVVLNGSENWLKTSTQPTSGNHSRFIIANFPKDVVQTRTVVICDKYNNQKLFNESSVGIYVEKNINITVDGVVEVEEFKNNLKTNPVTVVYQLAEERVYECTNIDLITYNRETNYVVESGAIAPKTTLKVHNNISNVVSLLQKKVSLLESNVKASQEVQDMMILETDMRMLDIELALMDFMPMTLNLGGSNMLRSATYFNFLKNHIVNETYEKEYLENVMNKYLATGRINQDEYNELYKMLYPPVYDIELPIKY